MLLLSIILLFAGIIGYLSQSTGLCLVNSVRLALKRRFSLLFATLLSGSFSWISISIGQQSGLSDVNVAYGPNFWIALGGFMFGIGAAFNHACTLSTLYRLMRGDIRMFATIIGWALGWWCFTQFSLPLPEHITLFSEELQYWTLFVISMLVLIWAFFGNPNQMRLWLSISMIGVLGGILFLYQPNWPPSALVNDISYAVVGPQETVWPEIKRYLLTISLLSGMFYAAYSKRDFKWRKTRLLDWPLHLFFGTIMGFGSSMALGGNDAQLLIALPNFSLASVVAILSMLIGITVVLVLQDLRK